MVDVSGFWFLPTEEYHPDPSLVEFLKVNPENTIYIGFGSVIVSDPSKE